MKNHDIEAEDFINDGHNQEVINTLNDYDPYDEDAKTPLIEMVWALSETTNSSKEMELEINEIIESTGWKNVVNNINNKVVFFKEDMDKIIIDPNEINNIDYTPISNDVNEND